MRVYLEKSQRRIKQKDGGPLHRHGSMDGALPSHVTINESVCADVRICKKRGLNDT